MRDKGGFSTKKGSIANTKLSHHEATADSTIVITLTSSFTCQLNAYTTPFAVHLSAFHVAYRQPLSQTKRVPTHLDSSTLASTPTIKWNIQRRNAFPPDKLFIHFDKARISQALPVKQPSHRPAIYTQPQPAAFASAAVLHRSCPPIPRLSLLRSAPSIEASKGDLQAR